MYCHDRKKSEVVLFTLMTVCLVGSIGLCITSMVVPNWAHVEFLEGVVIVKASVGMLRTQLCDYQGCQTYWFTEYEYERNPKSTIRSQDTIRTLLSSGISSGVVALSVVWYLWQSKNMDWCRKIFLHVTFAVLCFLSASLSVSGPVMTSIDMKPAFVGWAPILAGCGGGLMLVGVFLSVFVFRPREQHGEVFKNRKIPIDKIYFMNMDFNSFSTKPGMEEKKVPI